MEDTAGGCCDSDAMEVNWSPPTIPEAPPSLNPPVIDESNKVQTTANRFTRGGKLCIIDEESCYQLLADHGYFPPIANSTGSTPVMEAPRSKTFKEMVRAFASISGVSTCWSRVGRNAFIATMLSQGFTSIVGNAAFDLFAQFEQLDLLTTWKTVSRTLAYPTSIFGSTAVSIYIDEITLFQFQHKFFV